MSAAPGRIARLAAAFWSDADGPPGFPRDPEPLIELALPVSVQDVPALSADGLRAWAARRGFPPVETGPERALRGCLLAHRGQAFLLLDPHDPPDERRVTVAHELGHFLLEVWWPRHAVRRAVNPEALAVLDGERPATLGERLDAALAGLHLEAYAHLMTREDDGSIGCIRVAAAEEAADRFALELLAPGAALREPVQALSDRPRGERWARATELLTARYGLPPIVAGGYARSLVDVLTGGPSVREWLGL